MPGCMRRGSRSRLGPWWCDAPWSRPDPVPRAIKGLLCQALKGPLWGDPATERTQANKAASSNQRKAGRSQALLWERHGLLPTNWNNRHWPPPPRWIQGSFMCLMVNTRCKCHGSHGLIQKENKCNHAINHWLEILTPTIGWTESFFRRTVIKEGGSGLSSQELSNQRRLWGP